ncbi:response regulator [Hyalangium minutum]|uniref:phosphorylase family protein n=1 Tax=Hyalangium minutum TaxID=394096 RepID=UPI00094B1036|nr:response regulator [Hyalangium minutum]
MGLSVLVVDDEQMKLERFVKILVAAGVQRDNITIAQNSYDARDKLRRNQYSLMILDLALPNRPEERPSDTGGLDLIDEIHERDGFYRPMHIVVVTAREDLSRLHEARLANRLINLLYFDHSSERWQNQLKMLISDLFRIKQSRSPVRYNKDVCVLTALREPELRAVRDLPWGFDSARLLDHSSFYYEGSFAMGGQNFSVVASAAPRMGLVATTLHAMKYIEAFRPRVLVMTGICAGLASRSNVGDVILATPVWEWQSGKRVKGKGKTDIGFLSDPHHLDVEPLVVSRFEQLIDNASVWSQIASGWRGPKPPTSLKGIVGPVASGSVVLADGTTVLEIQEHQHRKIAGIEMEIYGLYAAAREVSEPRPLMFAMKSVSDLADSKKSDDFQSYAAYSSAQALRCFLETNIAEFIDSLGSED